MGAVLGLGRCIVIVVVPGAGLLELGSSARRVDVFFEMSVAFASNLLDA